MATRSETVGTNRNLGSRGDEDKDRFAELKDSVSLTHGQLVIFASVVFFQFVNWLVKSYGPPKYFIGDEWKWRNLFVSWIHALIASALISVCTFLHPELYVNLLHHITHVTFYSVCFSTGYFLYDFLDLLVNKKVMAMWEVTLHHITVAGMFYFNIHLKAQIAFSIVALCVEVNSIFLHWRKMLQMDHVPYDRPKYVAVKYLNLVTFVIFRGGPLVTISTACIIWRHKLPIVYVVCVSTTAFFLDVLHTVFFWRLFKSDVLRHHRRAGTAPAYSTYKKDDASKENYNNNNNIADVVNSRKRIHQGAPSSA